MNTYLKSIPLFLLFAICSSMALAQSQNALLDSDNLLAYFENVDEKQKEEIKVLSNSHEQKHLNYNNHLEELQARLKRLESAVKVDMDKINETVNEISSLQAKALKNKIEHRQKVRDVLTDEQRIDFDKKLSEGKLNQKVRTGCRHGVTHKCMRFSCRKRSGS